MDHFGWHIKFMMNVGDKKGLILDKHITAHKPKVGSLKHWHQDECSC